MTFRSYILPLILVLLVACGSEAESSTSFPDLEGEEIDIPEPPVDSKEIVEEIPVPSIEEEPISKPIPPSTSSISAAFRSEMLELVNNIRAEGCTCGDRKLPPAPPLTWNGKLAQAALAHAKDMEQNNFIGHKGSDGSKISDRVSRAKYQWGSVGENVSWNLTTVAGAVQGWKDSPGHCRNMMNGGFTEMGAAQEGAYMVQVFGRP